MPGSEPDPSPGPVAAPTPPPGLRAVSSRRVVLDILGQLVTRGGNIALGIAVTIVLVRVLGDARFGQWSTILAIVQIVGYFGDLGLEQIAVRRAAEDADGQSQWLSSLLTFRLAVGVPVTLVTLVVTLLLAEDSTMRATGVILSGTVLVGSLAAYRTIFQLHVRNSTTAAFELANGIVWGLAVVLVAVLDGGMIALAWAFLGAALVTNLAQAVVAHRLVPLRPSLDRDQVREFVKVGVPVAVGSLLILSYGRIDQVLVFHYTGDRGAGLYGAAYRILDRAMLLPGTVVATIFPLMAAAHATDIARVRRLVQLGAEVIATITFPVLPVMAFLATPVIELLFGREFSDASTAFAILMGLFAISGFGYMSGYLVLLLGLQKRFIVIALVGLVVNVGLNVLLLPRYGFEAAAVVTIVTDVVVVGWSLHTSLGVLQMRLAFGRLARLIGASLAAGLVAGGVHALGLGLVPAVAAAIVAYVALVLGTRAWTVPELRAILARNF
ncbi:MAG: polysaccharide biosynthesis protein [Solirubrobacterales bacterium]|nr:polysaccharide biosynthesis protein [Solirubrobacterales bacterium]